MREEFKGSRVELVVFSVLARIFFFNSPCTSTTEKLVYLSRGIHELSREEVRKLRRRRRAERPLPSQSLVDFQPTLLLSTDHHTPSSAMQLSAKFFPKTQVHRLLLAVVRTGERELTLALGFSRRPTVRDRQRLQDTLRHRREPQAHPSARPPRSSRLRLPRNRLQVVPPARRLVLPRRSGHGPSLPTPSSSPFPLSLLTPSC